MSSDYYTAVQKHLPQTPLVFDGCHIVKLMNEKLTKLRCHLAREAGKVLKDWCGLARAIRDGGVTDDGQYLGGLLNWYRLPISTGPLEGMNNKIKTLKRQACGYRDLVDFTLKFHELHSAKCELIG